MILAAQDSRNSVQHHNIMFWNVENAFWPEDDPNRDDEDFTPEGSRHWTFGRLRHKLLQLTRVILAAGNGKCPMLVGLAEVEGDSVLNYWTKHTPLWDQHYEYIVSNSNDVRGIQTALLYEPTDFKLITASSYHVALPSDSRPTRDILLASGRLISGDTLDVLVCHLPSQLGGARQSRPSRDAAHRTLLHVVDSLRSARKFSNIVVMGDMNEAPSSRHCWWNNELCNLMLPLQKALSHHPSFYGSHKYQGKWSFLDQFLVNSSLAATMHTDSLQRVSLRISNPRSFSLPFMMIEDDTHLGHRPQRSYYGYQYEGGYSDHLPILLDLDIYF